MTTPVNSFQDILDALERDSSLREQVRSHILTEELLQLPAQFLLLRADVDKLKAGQSRLEEDVASLKEGQARLEEDVASLKEGQESLRAGQESLRAGQESLRAGQESLERRMNRVEGRLGNIEGNQYEERAVNRIVGRAWRLGIEGAQIAFSKTGQSRQDFHDAMAGSVQSSVISQDEYDDLTEADLIVRGRNRHHAVVEISLGPDEGDMTRALRRADILHRAISEQVSAVIAAPDPDPTFAREAEGRNLHVLDIPA